MKFEIGDIVERYDGTPFRSTNQFYGRIVEFENNTEDSWFRIEGEYYMDSLNRECVNYYNPKYLIKVEEPGFVLISGIKRFNFI